MCGGLGELDDAVERPNFLGPVKKEFDGSSSCGCCVMWELRRDERNSGESEYAREIRRLTMKVRKFCSLIFE